MSDGMMFIQNEAGEFEKYDDTYDITIHCKSAEEHEKILNILENSQWIPCSERLPEESDYYMACVYDEEVDDYDYRKNWFAHKDDYDTDESEWRELMPFERVTAWMPLPEPYKQNDEGVEEDEH